MTNRALPCATVPGASMLVQPFAQHHKVVQPLAMVPQAVTVLPCHGANPGRVEPAAIAQALTFRRLAGPGAGRPRPEPHLQWGRKAVLRSLEEVGRDEPLQQRFEQRLAAIAIYEPLVRQPEREFQHFLV